MTLFPRNAGNTCSQQKRMKAMAHRLLDRAKLGDISVWDRVDWALKVLGDLE